MITLLSPSLEDESGSSEKKHGSDLSLVNDGRWNHTSVCVGKNALHMCVEMPVPLTPFPFRGLAPVGNEAVEHATHCACSAASLRLFLCVFPVTVMVVELDYVVRSRVKPLLAMGMIVIRIVGMVRHS